MTGLAWVRKGRCVAILLETAGEWIASICIGTSGIALAGIVVINGANVVGRYGFGRPLAWAEEAMVYLAVLAVFAGGAAACWKSAHVRIDALAAWLPNAASKLVELVVAVVAAAVLMTVAGTGLEVVSLLHAYGQRSDALALPIWIPQSAIVGGLGLGSLLILMRVVLNLGAKDEEGS
jgi:TRAP-type C4-dicarboxylate transport system permease small subunit